jgi:hypothetical protein
MKKSKIIVSSAKTESGYMFVGSLLRSLVLHGRGDTQVIPMSDQRQSKIGNNDEISTNDE